MGMARVITRVGGTPMLQSAKKSDRVIAAKPAKPEADVADSAWLRTFSHHLGRLYEPSCELPSDLDKLVKAVARRIAE